jgi:putative inorganic carbon (hco3(-)) transporter
LRSFIVRAKGPHQSQFFLKDWFYQTAEWVTAHELWFLAVAGSLLLFPRFSWPWVGAGVISLPWVCRRLVTGHFTVHTRLEIPISFLLVMACLGYLISLDPAISQARFWSLILGIACFYAFANLSASQQRVGSLVLFLGLLTIGIAAISLAGTDWGEVRLFPLPWLYSRIPTLLRGLPASGVPRTSDLFNPRWIGITMGMLVPVLLSLLFFGRDRKLRLFTGAAALFGMALLLLSQSIQGLVGLAAGVFFLLIWRSRWFLLLIFIPLGLAILGIAIFPLNFQSLAAYLLSQNNPLGIAVVLRLDIWSRALAMIRDLPYTGIGLNTFPILQSQFYPGFLLGLEPHAHNLYLQTALDLGLPGLFAFIWMLVVWFSTLRRNYQLATRWEYRVLLVGLAAGIISYLAHGFLDAMMLGSKPGVAFWILLGIGASIPIIPIPEKAAQSRKLRRQNVVNLGLAVILIASLLVSVIIRPSVLPMNLAILQAQKLLNSTSASQNDSIADAKWQDARANLWRALSMDGKNAQAYELLGEIEAWSGREPQALEAFIHRVISERDDPLLNYLPTESPLQMFRRPTIPRAQAADDLIQFYTNLTVRYPQRAEHYLRLSLAWQIFKGDAKPARQVLEQGLENHAEPRQLLEYALKQISP